MEREVFFFLLAAHAQVQKVLRLFFYCGEYILLSMNSRDPFGQSHNIFVRQHCMCHNIGHATIHERTTITILNLNEHILKCAVIIMGRVIIKLKTSANEIFFIRFYCTGPGNNKWLSKWCFSIENEERFNINNNECVA